MHMVSHEQYMHRCIQLASIGAGFVAPNPMVGAVLVHGERIIGEGWHKQYGQAHAEVNCLESVVENDRHLIPESTLYVSLEPCAHFGKTPPCANRIISEGIRHVVVGTLDPFPEVYGRGVAILQQVGVKTEIGVLEVECRIQNRRFFTFHEQKRPYIHLKWAQTADGYISGSEGDRLLITNPFTNRLVHKWRSEETAVMVGTRTAAVDNPQLSNRLWSGPQPLRVVVDSTLKLSKQLNVFNNGGRTIVLNELEGEWYVAEWCAETRTGAMANGVQFVKVPGLSSHDPKIICEALFKLNIQSVFIEGGAALLNSFLHAGLWDEAHILTNTELFAGGGLKAPGRPAGLVKESFFNGTDSIEWMIKG
jgi:diaminohydroxyphosphoribosylaminopyrimidine deaminase/5-amino-6-(5-phosphoribosylamino)uracil reductase